MKQKNSQFRVMSIKSRKKSSISRTKGKRAKNETVRAFSNSSPVKLFAKKQRTPHRTSTTASKYLTPATRRFSTSARKIGQLSNGLLLNQADANELKRLSNTFAALSLVTKDPLEKKVVETVRSDLQSARRELEASREKGIHGIKMVKVSKSDLGSRTRDQIKNDSTRMRYEGTLNSLDRAKRLLENYVYAEKISRKLRLAKVSLEPTRRKLGGSRVYRVK